MAAMDFGMAVTAGIIPASKEAQKDLINLAGGREVFKSEGWWNRQVDKQISKGYRKGQFQTLYKVDTGLANAASIGAAPKPSGEYVWKPEVRYTGIGGGMQPPKGAVYTGGDFATPKKYVTRVNSLGFGEDRTDFTASELTDIEKGAKRGAERVKKEAGEKTASRKRLARGTGGLVAKARQPGDAPATRLPELGTTGLGMTAGLFGSDIKL